MKKSLLALAVLGAFASAAQAQTSVTLYGIVDAGLLYRSGINQTLPAPAAGTVTSSSAWSITSGIEATNRWGIRGSEDLGGGLKGTFALENGFSSNTGAFLGNTAVTSVSGKLFDRGSTVGLTGGFGSVTIGRNWSPFVMSQIAIDSNGFSNFGSLNSLAFQVGTVPNPVTAAMTAAGIPSTAVATQANLSNGFTTYWVDNSVVYTTPSFGGFTASGLYAFGGQAGDNQAGRTWSFSGTYANGPLTVAAGYFDSRANTSNGLSTVLTPPLVTTAIPLTETGQRFWHLGGKYNFGVLTASLEWANYKSPYAANIFNVDFYDLGVAVPVGPNGVFYANYLRKRDKNASAANGHLYKFAYDHNFSKTFTAYVNLGFTRNSSAGTMGVQNSGYTLPGESQTALGVGLRKAF